MENVDNPLAKRWFIGDPCYVIDHEIKEQDDVWSEFCNHLDAGPFTHEGTKIQLWGEFTDWGDGTYSGRHADYSVDAGMIGVASIDHLPEDEIESLKRLGSIYEFKHGPEVHKVGSHIQIFDGSVLIEDIDTE